MLLRYCICIFSHLQTSSPRSESYLVDRYMSTCTGSGSVFLLNKKRSMLHVVCFLPYQLIARGKYTSSFLSVVFLKTCHPSLEFLKLFYISVNQFLSELPQQYLHIQTLFFQEKMVLQSRSL